VTAICRTRDIDTVESTLIAPFTKAFNESDVQRLESALLDLTAS
jgi:hypothetical protein